MNKNRVDQLIPKAYEALKDVGIVNENTNKIERGFTGQISTFGASMMTGSVLATMAFFSKDKDSCVERSKILRGIEQLLFSELDQDKLKDWLFLYVRDEIVTNENRILFNKLDQDKLKDWLFLYVRDEIVTNENEELILFSQLEKDKLKNWLFFYVRDEIVKNKNEKKVKEELIDCVVALKLAMNLYTLTEDKEVQIES